MSHKTYSIHHLIPTSKGWPNSPENKERIRDTTHINHHKVFVNETPQEQLIHILEFNKKIFNDNFVKEIIKVLDKYIYNYYKFETHISDELGSLLRLEQEYFSSKHKDEK